MHEGRSSKPPMNTYIHTHVYTCVYITDPNQTLSSPPLDSSPPSTVDL